MKFVRLAVLTLACGAAPAFAGPPYLTDDPVPTDTGHWEIYAFTQGEGRGSSFDADAGLDLNYGAADGVQLTATVPLSVSHDDLEGWHGGSGDVELGVKYRFLNKETRGFSAAIFPRVILPTASLAGTEKTRLLLPLWLEKDFTNGTSVFGGGGYEVNPGKGNRDFWQAAIALIQNVSKKVSLGCEVAWQQPDTLGGTRRTNLGVGTVVKLNARYGLLISGGPTWMDHRGGYHFYAALGTNL